MRILQLGKFYPIGGGVEKVMYELMIGLSEKGVRCDMMAAVSEGTGYVKRLNECAQLICCNTWRKLANTMIAPAMITLLNRIAHRYDIVHVHHPDPMACLALWMSGYKGKVIVHWHSDIQKQKVLLKFYEPLQRWLLKRADVIVGTSPVYLEESPHLQHVQHKTVSLPIGIEPICPVSAEVEKLKNKYDGKKIIFSLGRLVPYKGYRYLIEAARYLPDDYVILIGGKGPLFYELQSYVTMWGLTERVHLLGRVSDEDLPAYYGACDLFCLSSVQKTEAFGIVQIEAMSCGTPVVATTIEQSGVAWVNRHGVSGYNVQPENAKELADAFVRIMENKEAYKVLAEGAKKHFENMFTKEKMISNAIEIYKGLWGK